MFSIFTSKVWFMVFNATFNNISGILLLILSFILFHDNNLLNSCSYNMEVKIELFV